MPKPVVHRQGFVGIEVCFGFQAEAEAVGVIVRQSQGEP